MTHKISIGYACHEDVGEVQAVFDEKGKLIDAWSCDDANWRHEYFNGFLKDLGVDVSQIEPNKKQLAAVKKHFGL